MSTGGESGMDDEQAEMSLLMRQRQNSCVPGESRSLLQVTALTNKMLIFGAVVRIVSSVVLELELSWLLEFGCGSISSETDAHIDVFCLDMGFSIHLAGKVILL